MVHFRCITSVCVLFLLVLEPFLVGFSLSTHSATLPWTRANAEHLARRALIAPTEQWINQLENAGSADAAVALLFPNQNGPDRTNFNAEITTLTASGFDYGSASSMRKLYQLGYARDPYEAKVKLFSLFEDTFSVNVNAPTITYADVKSLHDLIYSYTLGNYKTLVKRVLLNNGTAGDYAMGAFLNLLDQPNSNAPNQNYARELLQLFLMGEYLPGESKDAGNTRNYEETDVVALSKILTGFRSDSTTHRVYWDGSRHNSSQSVAFLTGALASGVSFPFYTEANGTLNLVSMRDSLLGNNGLADNTIEYIFAKRSHAIALFLADKLFRMYVRQDPTRPELENVATTLEANNFEILPTIKTLLASDAMYSEASMNEIRVKTPLELTFGTVRLLHPNDNSRVDGLILDENLLANFGWTPYTPGSIFGREGFDDNRRFYNAYLQNQWMSYASAIAMRDGNATGFDLSNIIPFSQTLSGAIASGTGFTLTGSALISSGSITLSGTLVGSGATLSMDSINQNLSVAAGEVLSGETSTQTGTTDTGSTSNTGTTNSGTTTESGTAMGSNTGSSTNTWDTSTQTGSDTTTNSGSTSTGNTTNSWTTDTGTITSTGSNSESGSTTETGSVSSTGNTSSGNTTNTGSTESGTGTGSSTGTTNTGTSTQSTPQSNSLLQEAPPAPTTIISFGSEAKFLTGSMTIQIGSGILSISTGSVLNTTDKTLTLMWSTYTINNATYTVLGGSIAFSTLTLARSITRDEFITGLERAFLLGRSLNPDAKLKLQTYLDTNPTTNLPRAFTPTNAAFRSGALAGAVAFVLAQPEFIIQSGYSTAQSTESTSTSVFDGTNSKLVIMELGGGYDWLQGVVPKAEYDTTYQTKRNANGKNIVLNKSTLLDAGEYYLNPTLAPFKDLYDQNFLRIVNRVGTDKHSSDHDAAQKQMASFASSTETSAEGIIGHLAATESDPSKVIALGMGRPNAYRGGNFLNIGSYGARMRSSVSGTQEKAAALTAMKNSLSMRNYPGNTKSIFVWAMTIDTVAQTTAARGGTDGAGYGNVQNFQFLENLLDANTGRVFYMRGDGWYDTHTDQTARTNPTKDNDLSTRIGLIAKNTTDFFNRVRDRHDITIVIFSEFGRTIEVNGGGGTDHGQGGGMFIVSNNPSFLQGTPQKVIGNIILAREAQNYLKVGVEYRSIYGRIFRSLYGLDENTMFGAPVSLENDTSLEAATIQNVQESYQAISDNRVRMSVNFGVSGKNFNRERASQLSVSVWGSKLNAGSITTPEAGKFKFIRDNQAERGTISYSVDVLTDQLIPSTISRTVTLPDVLPGSINSPTWTGASILRKYENMTVSGATALAGSGILLADTTGTGGNARARVSPEPGIQVRFGSGKTWVPSLFTDTGSTSTPLWWGGFVPGKTIPTDQIIGTGAKTDDGINMNTLNVTKVVKIGADTPGVGMRLSQEVQMDIQAGNGLYEVYSSEDGLTWYKENAIGLITPDSSGIVTFRTNHFSYFALVAQTPSCTISADRPNIGAGESVTLRYSIKNASTASLGTPTASGQALSWDTSVGYGAQTLVPNAGTTQYVLYASAGSITSTCSATVSTTGQGSNGNSGWGGGGFYVAPSPTTPSNSQSTTSTNSETMTNTNDTVSATDTTSMAQNTQTTQPTNKNTSTGTPIKTVENAQGLASETPTITKPLQSSTQNSPQTTTTTKPNAMRVSANSPVWTIQTQTKTTAPLVIKSTAAASKRTQAVNAAQGVLMQSITTILEDSAVQTFIQSKNHPPRLPKEVRDALAPYIEAIITSVQKESYSAYALDALAETLAEQATNPNTEANKQTVLAYISTQLAVAAERIRRNLK